MKDRWAGDLERAWNVRETSSAQDDTTQPLVTSIGDRRGCRGSPDPARGQSQRTGRLARTDKSYLGAIHLFLLIEFED